MNTIHGNILDVAERGRFDVVVHGANCRHTMGAGIAKQIRDRWPEAWHADQRVKDPQLGGISIAVVTRNGFSFYVVNGYTQSRPGPCADLHAIEDVFERVQESFHGKRIGYPRIGCGLGGLKWDDVGPVIERALRGEDHALVEWP